MKERHGYVSYRLKIKTICFLILSILIIYPFQAVAEETEGSTQMEKGYLKVSFESKAELSEEDRFKVVVGCPDGRSEDMVFGLERVHGKMILDTGDYQVKSVSYLGTNSRIIGETYAADTSFSIKESEETLFTLYIGEDKIASVNEKDLLFGNKKEKPSPEKEELSSVSGEKAPAKTPKNVVEKVEEKESETGQVAFHVTKLIPLLVTGIAGMLLIFAWNGREKK